MKPASVATDAQAPAPSIGRIVHFTANDGSCRAAIVCHVHPDELVNLSVFDDVARSNPAIFVQEGTEPDTWHWPEKVRKGKAAKPRDPGRKPRRDQCTECGGTGEVRCIIPWDDKFDEMVSCNACEDDDV